MKERCFSDVFAEKREKLCPEVNGNYKPMMLRGIIHEATERVEVIWDDRISNDASVRQLRTAFAEALNTYASEAKTHALIEPVMGHVAVRPLVEQAEVVGMMQQHAHLRPFEAA